MCQLFINEKYENTETLRETFENLYKAVGSRYNLYSYAKSDSINYKNAIVDVVEKITSAPDVLNQSSESEADKMINVIYDFVKSK